VTHHLPTRAASLWEYTPPHRWRQRCPRGGQPDCRRGSSLSIPIDWDLNPVGSKPRARRDRYWAYATVRPAIEISIRRHRQL